MLSKGSLLKFGFAVLTLSVLSGCAVVHGELGEILSEKKQFNEYWELKPGVVPGHDFNYMHK